MILANGCNITKSEKFKGVWILSVPTVSDPNSDEEMKFVWSNIYMWTEPLWDTETTVSWAAHE